MTNTLPNKKITKEHRTNSTSNWGAKLFLGTLFAVLAFFWWLLIHSGGVGGHHG